MTRSLNGAAWTGQVLSEVGSGFQKLFGGGRIFNQM
jgi:hypothetical protein